MTRQESVSFLPELNTTKRQTDAGHQFYSLALRATNVFLSTKWDVRAPSGSGIAISQMGPNPFFARVVLPRWICLRCSCPVAPANLPRLQKNIQLADDWSRLGTCSAGSNASEK